MTVLVGIPCLLTGGTEVQTLSLVEALVAAGHKPLVVCYFEHDAGMVGRYEAAGAKVVLLSDGGSRPQGIKATAKFLWRGLRGVVRAERPEVAHVQYMAPGALPVVLLRLLGVRKIVATTHTDADIYSANGKRIIRLLSKHLLKAFQCITLRAERAYFGTASLFDGALKEHFTIYNNIPSHIAIATAPRAPLAADAPITVGVISRLEAIKGMDLVVPAFAQAVQQNARLRLLVVGDGSQRQLMEQQAAEAGILDRVEFVGRQPQASLQSFYDRIDVLLMPSRSEGFGLTAIEGMARGCVPVVADVGGLPEVVTSACGYLHKAGDAGHLATQILKAADAESLSAMSAAAVARAAIFAKEEYNEQIKQLYKALQ